MPRTPVDYSKTLIYKLVHKEDYDNANIYIGSTTDFTRRKNLHKSSCNNEKDKEYNAKKYHYIRENGGWEEWNMIEIEKHNNCNDGNEARAREEYWRSHFNSQLNMIRAYTTEEEKKEQRKVYYEQHKEKISDQMKEYYETHKDKLIEQRKVYYEQHKEKISEQQKEYNEQHKDKKTEYNKGYKEQNKDKIVEKQKERYEQNKDKILEYQKEQITCECGCMIRRSDISRHRKTQKHLLLTKKIKYEFVDDNEEN
jgi:hypothetical protein